MGQQLNDIAKNINIHTREAKLFIRSGMNSFAYMVKNKNGEISLFHFDQFEEIITDPVKIGRRLQRILVENTLFKESFKQVDISYDSAGYTIIPDQFFNEDEAPAFLKQVTTVLDSDQIEVDSLSFLKSKLIFSIDKGIQFLFSVHFPKCKIHHSISTWLFAIHQYTKEMKLSCKLLFANIEPDVLKIALLDDGKLLITNHFIYRSEEDLRYFLFLIFDQFNLDPAVLPVYLSGNITHNNSAYQAIYPYFKNLNIVKWFDGLPLHSNMEPPAHLQRYFNVAGMNFLAT